MALLTDDSPVFSIQLPSPPLMTRLMNREKLLTKLCACITEQDRDELVRSAMKAGMPFNEIELCLDQYDLQKQVEENQSSITPLPENKPFGPSMDAG